MNDRMAAWNRGASPVFRERSQEVMSTKNRPAKLSTGIIILASVLLAGILALTCGYVRSNTLALCAGLAITAIGVAVGVLRIAVNGHV